MKTGRSGMGNAKHRKSGRVPVNTRSKVLRAIEANRQPQKRPTPPMFGSVKEAMEAGQ